MMIEPLKRWLSNLRDNNPGAVFLAVFLLAPPLGVLVCMMLRVDTGAGVTGGLAAAVAALVGSIVWRGNSHEPPVRRILITAGAAAFAAIFVWYYFTSGVDVEDYDPLTARDAA